MNRSIRTDLDYLEARAGYVVPKVALRVIAYFKKRWKDSRKQVRGLLKERQNITTPVCNDIMNAHKYGFERRTRKSIKARTDEGPKRIADNIKLPDYTTNPGGDKYNEDLMDAIYQTRRDSYIYKKQDTVDEIRKDLQKLGYGYMSWDSCKKWTIFVHGVSYSTEGFTFRQSWFDTELSAYQSAYDVIKK